jgi:hypothetical protein
VLSLGIEKKSFKQSNNIVYDVGGEVEIGFGITGAANGFSGSGGSQVGTRVLLKAGYLMGEGQDKGKFVPMIGLGPYFITMNVNQVGNYIYGLQGYGGVDIKLNESIVLTPQAHFGIASYGWSDNGYQNGQPGMFEFGVKIAKKF